MPVELERSGEVARSLGKGLLRGTRVMAWFVTRSRGELRMHSRLNNLLLTFSEWAESGRTDTDQDHGEPTG